MIVGLTGCWLVDDADSNELSFLKDELNDLREELEKSKDQVENLSDLVNNPSNLDLVAIQNVVNEVYSSSVYIHTIDEDNGSSGSGSGVIYKKEGNYYYVVTNYHVIEGGTNIDVYLTFTDKANATVIGSDKLIDLAILKIYSQSDLHVATLADSDDLNLGQFVFTLGSPLGYTNYNSTSFGVIANTKSYYTPDLGTEEVAYYDPTDLYQYLMIDAAINPGNSGGGVFDLDGNLIGINSLKAFYSGDGRPTDAMGYSIPSNTVKKFIKEIETKGFMERAKLGITNWSIEKAKASEGLQTTLSAGAYVASVADDSSALEAGILVGDIVTHYNGRKINIIHDLKYYLYYDMPTIGDTVEIKVNRNGIVHKLSLTLSL